MTVATHGNCLDGLASAALFTRLIRHVEPNIREFRYRTCIYGPTPLSFGPQLLNGDSNAILDYRFYPGTELTWYFDHHITAFSNQAESEVFQSRVESGRYHFDPKSASCAGLIGRVSERDFGLSLGHLESLVEFADLVDSARFQSAAAALDRSNPRARFLAVVERQPQTGRPWHRGKQTADRQRDLLGLLGVRRNRQYESCTLDGRIFYPQCAPMGADDQGLV